ncbi:beta-galactosidase [bacterium]|nr:beta-galactosidase [bacterium]
MTPADLPSGPGRPTRLPDPTFVFGSQYLRGMTPARSDWARDMATMHEAGFNTIRAWLVWGVIEPRQGEIDFDYLDEFLETALRNELRVGFLLHLYGCPEWAIREYPQYWYVDMRGLPFESSQRANTPSGGWPGLCPDHAEVQQLEASFIEGVAAHVADHPALAFWEPINEPHMWVDLAQNPPGPFCYCPATRAAFQDWLAKRYGSLDALEQAWGRRVSGWDDVRPPTWVFGYADWVDWRTFTAENIAALVDRRARLIRPHSSAPVIAHSWGGGCVTCPQLGAMAFDDWKNAAPVDKWGYSAFPSSPGQTMNVGLGTDATRNAAQGKEFWQSELGAGDYGSGLDRGGRIRPEVEAMFCWESIRHGAKGLLFWQFRKEAHGSEIGAFGLTDYAGNSTELLEAVSVVGRVLNSHGDLFPLAQTAPAPVALLFSYRTFMTDWANHRNCQLSVDSLSGYYRAFWDANLPVDVIHEEYVDADLLARYKVIILPNPAALAQEVRKPLMDYVRQGGTLLSDPYLCAFNHDLSLAREVPGDGFDEVFGCHEIDVTSARKQAVEIRSGECSSEVTGSHFREWFEPCEGAQVLGTYADGTAALVANRYGDGRAVISGLNLGLAYSTRQGVGDDFTRQGTGTVANQAGEIVLAIAGEAGVESTLLTPADIRASLLSTADGRHVLFAINTADAERSGEIKCLGASFSEAQDLIAGGTLKGAKGGALPLHFGPYESRVLLLR